MSLIKKIYRNLCKRIYSVGKVEFEKYQQMRIMKQATVEEGSVFYPGAELLNLTSDKLKIKIGRNCHIYGSLTVLPFSGSISFGDHCSFGDLSRIVSGKQVHIGNRVMIAHNVNILDNNSHPKDARLRHDDFMNAYSTGVKEYDLSAQAITIQDDVWIGFNSIILKGVTIGKGAIIGAGSVVTKDVDPWTVNVGNPLRCIQKLEPVNFNQ
jgi:acetyltransferase-like isoleucine patch superfamily enzyme